MSAELDLAPDLASQQWWDDNWIDVSLLSPSLQLNSHHAGRRRRLNMEPHPRVSHDSPCFRQEADSRADGGTLQPASSSTTKQTTGTYTCNSVKTHPSTGPGWKSTSFPSLPCSHADQRVRTLRTMYGKQYRFNLPRCQPPGFWLIEKIHKYQQNVRNDLGRMETVTKERLLEVFVITDRKVMKCSTLYDLANIRMVRPFPWVADTADVSSWEQCIPSKRHSLDYGARSPRQTSGKQHSGNPPRSKSPKTHSAPSRTPREYQKQRSTSPRRKTKHRENARIRIS
jgi:hypothetical protein